MAYKTVKASWLVEKFRLMLNEHWAYVADSARYGAVDCSGAFSYWYGQAGSYMPHGSNSMARLYAKKLGRIGEIDLKPGMAVFRWADDGGEPDRYKGDGLGNFRHVGLYVGDGVCIDARDSKTGVASGDISKWHFAAELKYTDYDLSEGNDPIDAVSGADAPAPKVFEPFEGVVSTDGGKLNLRRRPSTSATILARIPFGEHLNITDKQGDWYKTSYGGTGGWVSAAYITQFKPPFFRQICAEIYDEDLYGELTEWMILHGIDFYTENGDD